MNEILLDLLLVFGPSAAVIGWFIFEIYWPEGKTIPSGSEYLIEQQSLTEVEQ